MPTPLGIISPISAWGPSVASFIGWYMLVISWIITRDQNNVREDRHEMRGVIDSFTEEINALRDDTYEFYIVDASEDTAKQQAYILADYKSLKLGLQRLRKFNSLFRDPPRFFDFGDALIGGDFEQTNRLHCKADDLRLSQLIFTARQPIDQFESVYIQIYPPVRQQTRSKILLFIVAALAIAAVATLGIY